MDNDIKQAPKLTLTYKRLALGAIAVIFAVISTVIAVFALESPERAKDFETLNSAEDIKAEDAYLIKDLTCSGIFMYEGLAEETGTPRNSGDGIFLEKEHVYSYHTLAFKEQKDGSIFLFVFSVKRGDGELFDKIAEHDKAENKTGDKGSTFPTSVYVKAKELDRDAKTAFLKSKAKHEGSAGFENTRWAAFEMEYVCGAEDSYTSVVASERREWLKLSLGLLPLVALFLFLALRKDKPKEEGSEVKEFLESKTNIDNE